VKRQVENETDLNVSPWTFQVLKKELSRKKPDSEHILISDLTRGYTRPNIVDIKLGTLHHSQARATLKPTKYQTAVSLGYCIAEGAAVALADGTARRIELLDDLCAAAVASPSPATRSLEFARCAAAFASGVKRCVRLTLADGRTLDCTPDHRLLAADGSFVAARDIKPRATLLAVAPFAAVLDEPGGADERAYVRRIGDDFVLRMDCRTQRARTLAFARLAGRVVGCRGGAAARCVPASNALDRESLLRDIDTLDATVVVRRRHIELAPASACARALYDSDDVAAALALDDDAAPRAVVREFLAALLGASPVSFGRSRLRLTSKACSSERLCAWLARCGVAAQRRGGASVAVEYDAFCERVGFRHSAHVQRRAGALLTARRVAARQCKRMAVGDALRAIGASGAAWARGELPMLQLAVTGVAALAGARRVFDLTVPGNATFVANGVGVHNCIGGMMVWNEKLSSYHHIDKYVGRTLTDATIGGMLELFFAPDGHMHIKALIPTIRKLTRLLKFFDEQVAWRFHSTSLLVIYEGSPRHSADGDAESRVAVGLVDFAHAYMNHPGIEGRQPQVDAGCKLGIGNLIELFEQFAARKSLRVKRIKEQRTQWSSTIRWHSADDDRSAHSTSASVASDESSGDESSSSEPDAANDELSLGDEGGGAARRRNSAASVEPPRAAAGRKRSSSEQVLDVKRLSLLDALEKQRESGRVEDVEPLLSSAAETTTTTTTTQERNNNNDTNNSDNLNKKKQ
jgi:hypothetical protein